MRNSPAMKHSSRDRTSSNKKFFLLNEDADRILMEIIKVIHQEVKAKLFGRCAPCLGNASSALVMTSY